MRLDINFSGRKRPLLSVTSASLACLACVAIALAAWEYSHVHATHQQLVETLATVRQQATRQEISLTGKQIDGANQVIRQLNLPWQSIFGAIEGKLSERVTLLSLEPDATAQVLRLQAEAKSADDMVDFVEALKSDPLFVSAVLTRHEINESDRNRPYRFVLEAAWQADR